MNRDELPIWKLDADIGIAGPGHLSVETTGFGGGNSSHGARVTIRLDFTGFGGCISAKQETGQCVVLHTSGDWELGALQQSLELAAKAIKAAIENS